MSHTTYSTNGEDFRYSELEEAIEMVIDNETKDGDAIVVYSGTAETHMASDFMRHVYDDLAARAYDECGEWADGWPNATPEQEAELTHVLAGAVDSWANRHHLHPNFSQVHSVKEINMIVIDPERLLCRIVE